MFLPNPRRRRLLGRLALSAALVAGLVALSPATHAQHSADPVTITYWQQWTDPVQKGAMLQVIAAFEKAHPTITVHEVDVANDQKILTAITGGKPPDVASMWNINNLGDWASRGAIQNVQPLIQAQHADLNDYNASALGFTTYKGSLYGLPIEQDGFGLYVNLDAFHAAGLKAFPRTMSEVLADAVKLTKKDATGRITQLGFAGAGKGGVAQIAPYFNGSWYDAGRHIVTPDNPGVLQALQWEKSYVDKVGVQPFENFINATAHNPVGDQWLDGNEAMAIDGDWMCALTPAYNKKLHWVVAPAPYADGHPEWANSTEVIGSINVIPTGAAHPNEAFQFMQFAGVTQAQISFNRVIGNTPVTKSGDRGMAGGCFQSFIRLQAGPRATPFPVLPVANQYGTLITTAEDRVLRGVDTPAHAMSTVKQTVQAALSAFH